MTSNIKTLKSNKKNIYKSKFDFDLGIRVMSFNIHLKEHNEKKSDIHSWVNRKNKVVSVIKFHNMDLIGLQETTTEQLEDLKDLLANYEIIGINYENDNKAPLDAILLLKERFKVLEKGQFYLSSTPDVLSKDWKAKFVRGVTWVKLKCLKTNKIFYFYNTHFDYHSVLARNKSAELLKEKVKEISKNHPFIISGDFNIFPALKGKETYGILTKDKFFLDAHFKSDLPHHGPTGSWSGFKEPGQPGIKPDYIFVNKKINVKSHGILSDTFDGKFPSDHLPVISEIEIL